MKETPHPYVISEIYAFISNDNENDDEGVVAFMAPDRTWVPLIAADEQRLAKMRPIAEHIASARNIKIRLIRLSTREEIETITP